MLHDRRQGHREGTGELAHRDAVLLVEPGEQGPPGRIGEGGKGAVERGGLIVNHEVKNRPRSDGVKGAQVLVVLIVDPQEKFTNPDAL